LSGLVAVKLQDVSSQNLGVAQPTKGRGTAAVFLAIVGVLASGLIGYLIAVWQNRRSDKQSQSLAEAFDQLPQQFIEALRAGSLIVSAIPKRLTNLEGKWPSHISFADVDNDGTQELLVQYLAGEHGNALQVFGWRDAQYVEIARTGVGVPVPFEFGDFDGDGRIEISGQESDWSTGLPYSLVPRYSFRLRWEVDGFQEVWRANDYTGAELAELKRRLT
jgi:hypothetical protein